MSEQLQNLTPEYIATEFENGTRIDLHKSDLVSLEEARARQATEREKQVKMEKTPPTSPEIIKAFGRTLEYLRQAEIAGHLDLTEE